MDDPRSRGSGARDPRIHPNPDALTWRSEDDATCLCWSAGRAAGGGPARGPAGRRVGAAEGRQDRHVLPPDRGGRRLGGLHHQGRPAGGRRDQPEGRRGRLQARVRDLRQRHPGGRSVRPRPGGDQHPEVHRGRPGRGPDRPADERRGQGDLADPLRGRPADDHTQLDEPRHHRSEVPEPVPAQGQGDLLPHGDDRRLPGPEHGQPRLPQPEGQEGLHPGRQRGLRGGDRGQLRAAGEGAQDRGPRP